ncbi:MAG: hypothetical protein GY757_03560 [bacterium]|nr:hypothetical protein [bacterium]
MNEILEQLFYSSVHYDIIVEPEVGPMELQEIGIANVFDYNKKLQFAYAQDKEAYDIRAMVMEAAENLRIYEEETEMEDRISGKIVKTVVECEKILLDDAVRGFWLTFWYNAGLASNCLQGKVEMFIKPHSDEKLEKYHYDEAKKKFWITKLAIGCKKEYEAEIDMHEFNRYIKKHNMLWVLEDMITVVYDVYDLILDINKKMDEV